MQACQICVDAKVDYPAACNAVEKILVHRAHEVSGAIFQLQSALREAGVKVYGTEATVQLLGALEAPSLRHEYGTLEVTVDLVDSIDEAIDKIHKYGSGHTEVRREPYTHAWRARRAHMHDATCAVPPAACTRALTPCVRCSASAPQMMQRRRTF
jgi:gamma-glutamyl phosphate reductase